MGRRPTGNGRARRRKRRVSPLADLIPEGGDPVFALATAGLSPARKAVLEDQLKTLLRDEIVATASFATADMQRAAGRVLFYLRAGLELFGPTLGDATAALETRQLPEISAIGARLAESYRQRALALSGLRDWLDGRQRQFLDAMKQPEAGVDPETREPVLYLARPRQAGAGRVAPDAAGRGRHRAWTTSPPGGRWPAPPSAPPTGCTPSTRTAKTRTWDEAAAPDRPGPGPVPPLGAGTDPPRRGLRRLPPPVRDRQKERH